LDENDANDKQTTSSSILQKKINSLKDQKQLLEQAKTELQNNKQKYVSLDRSGLPFDENDRRIEPAFSMQTAV